MDGSAEHDTLVVQGHNNGLLNLQRREDWGATSTDRPTHRPPLFVQEEQGEDVDGRCGGGLKDDNDGVSGDY